MPADVEKRFAPGTDEEREVEELFAFYVDALNRGEEFHPQEILVKHPLVGEKLLECLEDYIDSDSALTDSPPRTLGDYTLRRQIGRGGMGVVYDAWQNSLDRQVALKVLPVGIAADDRAFHRFMREAKTAAKLNHQNVVRVYGMGVESNTPYYAMEHVEGKTLAQIIARREGETDEEVETSFGRTREGLAHYPRIASAFAEVADGLQHAHSKGVIHRDIKPSNLILDTEGRLSILDFGLARLEGQESLTLTRDVMGTLLYMSPEQARRRKIPIDHRTDIYSLGATLYEVLTRRPPFRGKDNQDTLTQIIEQDPSPARRFDPTIPKSLETIVLKCLRKNPKDRYDTAEAVAEDLRRFTRGEPISAQPMPPWAGAQRWIWKYSPRIGVIGMAASLVFLLVYSVLPTEGITSRQVLTPKDMDQNNFWDLKPSPDGRQIAYSRLGSDGALFVRDLESGNTTQLTSDEFTFTQVWSPDGKRIAYGRGGYRGRKGLKIVDIASKTSTVPKGTEGLGLTPLDWSPDGEFLLCGQNLEDSNASMVSLSLTDGEIKTLVASGWQRNFDGWDIRTAVFSRDGRHIAYTAVENGNQDVFVIAADGGGKQRISDAPGADVYPLWSPAGDLLVYTGQDGVWGVRIIDGRPESKPRFLRSPGFLRPLAWTKEAGLFYIEYAKVQVFYSLPVDPQTAQARGAPDLLLDVPVGAAYRCAWSPDMKRIAYSEYGDGQVHVYSTADRSLRSFALATKERPSNLWWSSDGKRQLYYVPMGTKSIAVFALDVASGQTEPLFSPMSDIGRFHLSPDGKEMVFYRWNGEPNDGRRELIVAEVGQRDGRVLAAEQEEEVGRFSNWVLPAFSPDGRRILFATENGKLWLAATDGSGRRILAAAGKGDVEGESSRYLLHFAAWHPQGDYVVYDNGKTLFVVKVETGEQHELSLPENLVEFIDGVWQWSPDGTQIVFTGGRGGGPELWTIKNLLAAKPTEN